MNENIASPTTHLETHKYPTSYCTNHQNEEEYSGITCYLHFLVVAYPHPLLSMPHLLAALCAPNLVVMPTVEMMLALPFHSPLGIGSQDHLSPTYEVSQQTI